MAVKGSEVPLVMKLLLLRGKRGGRGAGNEKRTEAPEMTQTGAQQSTRRLGLRRAPGVGQVRPQVVEGAAALRRVLRHKAQERKHGEAAVLDLLRQGAGGSTAGGR